MKVPPVHCYRSTNTVRHYLFLESLCNVIVIKTTCIFENVYCYHWVDTSVGGLLVPDIMFRPVVSVSARTWFIRIQSNLYIKGTQGNLKMCSLYTG